MVAYERKKQKTEKALLITLYKWSYTVLGVGVERREISGFLAAKNHRVLEWFGWEGTLMLISIQHPAISRDIFH